MDISLCGFYGYENYGDTLMSQRLKEFFGTSGFEVKIFSDRESSESLSFKKDNCLASDIVAIGGGGIVNQNFWFFKNNLHNEIYKQKLILLNVNLTEDSAPVLSELKDKISLAVVRDSYSEQIAKRYLSNVIFAPDISFLDKNFGIVKQEKKNIVSVCLNYYIFKNFFSSNIREKVYAERAIIEIASFLNWLTDRYQYEVRLIACQSDNEVNDNTVNAVLNGFLKRKAKWIYDKNLLEENIQESRFIISSRYHSSLFALKSEVPFLDITHHSKNLAFLRDVNLLDCSVDYWFIELNKLINKYEKHIKNLDLSNISRSYGVSCNESWSHVLNSINSL
jgi:polysaccharide pyruvyl transferase WcaK-like protein